MSDSPLILSEGASSSAYSLVSSWPSSALSSSSEGSGVSVVATPEGAFSVIVRESPLRNFVDALESIWGYTFATVDGSNITFGKVILALLLIVIGLYSSRVLSRLIAWALLRRTKVHEGAALAFQSISFYVLVATFSLLALEVVHIPLTVFTLLGGAVALGVGFGSQTLASNFIGGLILLFEQPVRVGDIIEVDTVVGTVVRIGLRSTLVRTPQNNDVIVPNTSLLDRRITNWTLSDANVRRSVNFNVVYGTNLELAKNIALKVIQDKAAVLQFPEPALAVLNLGLKGIECELRFWMLGTSITDCFRVESEVRVELLRAFEQAGIMIAVDTALATHTGRAPTI